MFHIHFIERFPDPSPWYSIWELFFYKIFFALDTYILSIISKVPNDNMHVIFQETFIHFILNKKYIDNLLLFKV